MALALNVVGLMNVQFAIQNGVVYVLEVNPRASRTAPFVSKATGVAMAKAGARVMTGRTLVELNLTRERVPKYFSVKEAVFPFGKFPDADPILGPEMKSTGEVMGTGRSFGEAYAKAQAASGVTLADPRGLPDQRARAGQAAARSSSAGACARRGSRSWRPRARPTCSSRPASSAGAPTRCARAVRTSST